MEGWPSSGEVEFKSAHHLFRLNDTDLYDRNYSTRYRPELDLVLKDISIKIVNLVPYANFSSANY